MKQSGRLLATVSQLKPAAIWVTENGMKLEIWRLFYLKFAIQDQNWQMYEVSTGFDTFWPFASQILRNTTFNSVRTIVFYAAKSATLLGCQGETFVPYISENSPWYVESRNVKIFPWDRSHREETQRKKPKIGKCPVFSGQCSILWALPSKNTPWLCR